LVPAFFQPGYATQIDPDEKSSIEQGIAQVRFVDNRVAKVGS
jgi:hypothetical protein